MSKIKSKYNLFYKGDYVITKLDSKNTICKVLEVFDIYGILVIKDITNKNDPIEIGNLDVTKVTNKKSIKMIKLLYSYKG